MSSRPKGDPGQLPIFQDFFTFVTPGLIYLALSKYVNIIILQLIIHKSFKLLQSGGIGKKWASNRYTHGKYFPFRNVLFVFKGHCYKSPPPPQHFLGHYLLKWLVVHSYEGTCGKSHFKLKCINRHAWQLNSPPFFTNMCTYTTQIHIH